MSDSILSKAFTRIRRRMVVITPTAVESETEDAKGAYLETLEHLQRYASPVERRAAGSFRENLRNISNAVRNSSPSIVKRSSSMVGDEIKRLFAGIRVLILKLRGDRRSVIGAISNAAGTLHSRSRKCNAIFEAFSRRVASLRQTGDIDALQAGITREIRGLKRSVDKALGESRGIVSKLHKEVAAAESLAYTDALTGLGNRRAADVLLDAKVQSGDMFTVILCDVDRFKSINDTRGHGAGDVVLRCVAASLTNDVGGAGSVFRWAGDEFLAVLNCGLAEASDVRTRIASGRLSCGVPELVAISSGMCQYVPGESANDLLERADAAMYRYKRANSRDERRSHGSTECRPRVR